MKKPFATFIVGLAALAARPATASMTVSITGPDQMYAHDEPITALTLQTDVLGITTGPALVIATSTSRCVIPAEVAKREATDLTTLGLAIRDNKLIHLWCAVAAADPDAGEQSFGPATKFGFEICREYPQCD